MTRTSHVFFAMPWIMGIFSIARSGSRRTAHPVIGGSIFAAATLLGLAGCDADELERPDLILLTIDHMAADRLHCFGGPTDAGLSICALAEGGTLFSFAASPGRGEASGVASILTGLSETQHGIGHGGQEFLADAFTTITEELRDVGYETAAFVASPRVNRSRRLDQGFDRYEDRRARSGDLPRRVRSWIENTSAPRFIWLHANRDGGLVEFDRLVARLTQTFDREMNSPGILFVSLRGERDADVLGLESARQEISWRSHRVPLIWRAHTRGRDAPVATTRHLVSLYDIAPTFRAAAQLPRRSERRTPSETNNTPSDSKSSGRDLSGIARLAANQRTPNERFVLLRVTDADGDVGLASNDHLYTRQSSPLDGTGRPVPMASLSALKARFASIPKRAATVGSNRASTRLEIGAWRADVLSPGSPVPRLEFHLARRLADAPESADRKDASE